MLWGILPTDRQARALNLYADHDPSRITFNLLPKPITPFLRQTWEESTNLFIDG
jgi:hypothetical protein